MSVDPAGLLLATSAGALIGVAIWYSYGHWESVQPLVKKYGWLLLIPVILIGIALMYVLRQMRSPGVATHQDAVQDAMHVIDTARASAAEADAELARRRLEAQASDDADVAKLNQFNVDTRKAVQIEDPAARRAELIRLVEGAR